MARFHHDHCLTDDCPSSISESTVESCQSAIFASVVSSINAPKINESDLLGTQGFGWILVLNCTCLVCISCFWNKLPLFQTDSHCFLPPNNAHNLHFNTTNTVRGTCVRHFSVQLPFVLYLYPKVTIEVHIFMFEMKCHEL